MKKRYLIIILSVLVILLVLLMMWALTMPPKQIHVDDVTESATIVEENIPETEPVTLETIVDQVEAESTEQTTESIPEESTDSTKETTQTPTEGTKPAETAKPTEITKPAETTKPTEATDVTESTNPAGGNADSKVTYVDYVNMSSPEQSAFRDSFDSTGAFIKWYNAAKDVYESQNSEIEVGDGSLNLDDFMNGNSGT